MEDLKEKEEFLNEEFNHIFNTYCDIDKIIFENLKDLKELFLLVERNLIDLYKMYKNENLDYNKVIKINFNEKIEIINNFYHDLGIDFDVNKLINDGTFDIFALNIDSLINNDGALTDGRQGEADNHFYISVFNSTLLTDAIIWVHEISHYRNDSLGIEPEIRRLLTEALAFTYEYIFIDYLDKIGYEYEGVLFKLNETKSLFRIIYDCYYVMNFLITYDTFGKISKENYLKLFSNNSYEDDFKRFMYIIDNIPIREIIQYSIAVPLAIYMYEEYKKDNSFILKIEKLNESVKFKSLAECLNVINIVNYNENGLLDSQNIGKIKNALVNLNKEIENGLVKISAKNNQDKKL